MIQRIQTIFLIFSALVFSALFFIPFATTSKPVAEIFSDTVYDIHDSLILIVLVVLGIVGAIGSIFLFRNRPLQIKATIITLIIGVLLPIAGVLIFMRSSDNQEIQKGQIDDGFGIYLPIVIILLLFLAIRYIRKDQKLVKSMDRLR